MTERPEGEQRELQVLDRERDADDRHGQAHGQTNVADEDPQAGEDEPEDVRERAEDRDASLRLDVLAERQKPEAGNLEALQAEGDPDDGEAEHDSRENVLEPDDKTSAEHDPEQVEEQSDHLAIAIGARTAVVYARTP